MLLLLKSFICAIITLGVIFGIVGLYSKLSESGQCYFWVTVLVAMLTFCFFCTFKGV